MPKNSYTFPLSPVEQAAMKKELSTGNYRPAFVEHAIIAGDTRDCRIVLYKTGKCVIQGKGATDFVTFTLEPLILQRAAVGYEDILDPDSIRPHFGVDESGKGDFFGPLVIAGAFVDEKLVPTMREMNVRDSKTITSDRVAIDMARDLRQLLGRRFSIVVIGPRAYNRLYAKMRNVNSMLAWAHARVIENLLEVLPDCPRAISDQFGNERLIKNALMKKGRKIDLVQRHKAESDMAVAAASVLARAGFLHALKQMEKTYGMPFAKGASEAVNKAAEELIRKHDPTILLDTVKCHFRTTDAVLAKVGKDRSVLGPEGRSVSKPYTRFHGRSKPAETPAADAP